MVEHSIDTAGANSVREAPRWLPYALRKQLEEDFYTTYFQLDKLLKISCIKAANSPYAPPIVPMTLKDLLLAMFHNHATS